MNSRGGGTGTFMPGIGTVSSKEKSDDTPPAQVNKRDAPLLRHLSCFLPFLKPGITRKSDVIDRRYLHSAMASFTLST